MTTNEADQTDDRGPATDVFAPDEAADEPEVGDELEAGQIEEGDEPRMAAEPEPSAPEEPEPGPVGIAEDDTVVDGDPSDSEARAAAPPATCRRAWKVRCWPRARATRIAGTRSRQGSSTSPATRSRARVSC